MYRALAVSPMGEVALAVREVAGEDWRGRVRISTDAMEELALKEGDVVEVEGSRLTAALAARGPPEDLGARTIRMDVWTARNAGVEAGGTVKVWKAKAAPAAVIVLETQTILEPSESFKSYVKSRLLGRPVVAGDVVPVNVLGAIYEFKVASTEPSGVVVVDESTRLTVVRAPARVFPRFSAPSGPAVIVPAGPTGALSSSPPETRRRVSGSAPELHLVR
jgi:transitional endoplasmic reticulum ATPase